MANQVTLTFAGETKDLEDGFGRAGAAARKMGDDVESSSEGFARAGEAADGAEGKAQGFSDTLTGVADIGGGTAEILKGNLFEGFVQVGQGGADLAGGLASFVIPALEKTKIGTLASAAASKIAAAGSKAWAGAQWLMNSALLASPITWIVVGIVALIAVIVLIATKTDWFQRAWRAAWGWIKDAASDTWNFIKQIPGWIGSAFSRIAGAISSPFRAAFNYVARAWNNTVGQLSWSVPGWVPFIGGNTISVPHLPTFHAGGVVPGVVGRDTVAVLQAGETVRSVAGSMGGGGDMIVFGSDGSDLGRLLIDVIRLTLSRELQGDPTALGIKVG